MGCQLGVVFFLFFFFGVCSFGYYVVEGRLVPKDNERTAIAQMKALRKKGKRYREISKVIADNFQVDMPAMTIMRILDRAKRSTA